MGPGSESQGETSISNGYHAPFRGKACKLSWDHSSPALLRMFYVLSVCVWLLICSFNMFLSGKPCLGRPSKTCFNMFQCDHLSSCMYCYLLLCMARGIGKTPRTILPLKLSRYLGRTVLEVVPGRGPLSCDWVGTGAVACCGPIICFFECRLLILRASVSEMSLSNIMSWGLLSFLLLKCAWCIQLLGTWCPTLKRKDFQIHIPMGK